LRASGGHKTRIKQPFNHLGKNAKKSLCLGMVHWPESFPSKSLKVKLSGSFRDERGPTRAEDQQPDNATGGLRSETKTNRGVQN